jgi:hypothetical protein
MRRQCWTAFEAGLLALIMLPAVSQGAGWVQVCSPGRVRGDIDSDSTAGARAVTDLVPFDGRLYVALDPSRSNNTLSEILSYDHGRIETVKEQRTAASSLGRFRLIQGRLYIPAASASGGKAGYYLSAGQGKWEWVDIPGGAMGFDDIARFDGKTLLAGSRGESAVVAWRRDGETEWHIEDLNAQAARFSYRASAFLTATNHLSLLAVRDVVGDWPPLMASRDWGAWYVLRYWPEKSVRGFLFDGPARPLPALRLLTPGSQAVANPKFGAAQDAAWHDGMLYVVLQRQSLFRDEKGGLFLARIEEGNPQIGRTFAARRVDGMGLARDVSVGGGSCFVLLAENAREHAKVVRSADLNQWETVFDGDLPAAAICTAVMNGECFIGLANGAVVVVKK